MLIGIDLLGMQHADYRGRGVGRYVENLIDALRQHDRINDYVLYRHEELPHDPFPWEAAENAGFIDDGGNWRIEAVPAGESIVSRGAFQPDLVLLTAPFSSQAVPRNTLGRPRLAAIIYDLIPFLFPERYLFELRQGEHSYNSLRALRAYDALLAISHSTKQDCETILGLAPGRVSNIGCASRDGFFTPCVNRDADSEGVERLRALGITGPYLFNVGGCDSRKNMEGLILAYGRLPRQLKDLYQLVITCRMADGWAERLRQAADVHGDSSRLIMTDSVPDETLRTLYQHCDLFVFPSEYEGFGLPILEAMQCGAPVIAGANSSQIEVAGTAGLLVNGADPTLLSMAMREVLGSNSLRSDLSGRGIQQAGRFCWEDVAQRTITAFAQAVSGRTVAAPARALPRRDLPRLAFFSPLPPKNSGISDYAVSLLEELKNRFRIDLYHDAGYVPNMSMASTEFKAFDYRMFPVRAASLDYRGILYQMGNCAAYHQFIVETLQRYPGVVMLHDFFLGDYQFLSAKLRNLPEQLVDEVRHCCPEALWSSLLDPELLGDSERFTSALRQHGQFMNHRIFELASRVLVHEQWNVTAAGRINADWPRRMSVVPFGCQVNGRLPAADRHALRQKYQLPADAVLIGCFGIAAPSKLSGETMAAFRDVALVNPQARLVFVGSSIMDLNDCAVKQGVADRVHVLGRVPLEDFVALAGAVDVGVNLRRPPTNGETSASLFTLLSRGTPTLVVDVDTFAGYPGNVVVKIPWGDDFALRLAHAMGDLAGNAQRREQLSQAGLNFLRDRHDWARVAALYAEVIERSAGTRKASVRPTTSRGRQSGLPVRPAA